MVSGGVRMAAIDKAYVVLVMMMANDGITVVVKR